MSTVTADRLLGLAIQVLHTNQEPSQEMHDLITEADKPTLENVLMGVLGHAQFLIEEREARLRAVQQYASWLLKKGS